MEKSPFELSVPVENWGLRRSPSSLKSMRVPCSCATQMSTVCIGPADSALSYLNIPNVLSAAEITGADAIHPGYGFLAENAHFAEVCESIGITFIGPSSEHIALLGDKSKARETMPRHGIPVMPGSEGELRNLDHAVQVAGELGYPVMVKASAGGGGRGLRVVSREAEVGEGHFVGPGGERERDLPTMASILKSIFPNPGTSKFRCWPMNTGTRFIWESETAPSSAATRSWWRNPRLPSWMTR